MLREHGIVLVACKGGNHRAPTVADYMKRGCRFIVHATLCTRRPQLCSEDVAVLVHACMKSKSGDRFYWELSQKLQAKKCKMQLCVGWHMGDASTGERDINIWAPKAGTKVQVLVVHGEWCKVKDRTGYTYTIPITWLIPSSVFANKEW